MFTIYRYAQEGNIPVWTGDPSDETAPLAFIDDMREFGPLMASGDTLTLGQWHYAIKN
jgi:hypothetical protein